MLILQSRLWTCDGTPGHPWTPDPHIRLQLDIPKFWFRDISNLACLGLSNSSPQIFSKLSHLSYYWQNPSFQGLWQKKLTVIPAYSLSLTLPIQQPTLVGPNFKIYSESHWFCHYLATPVWIIIILHLDYCHSLLTGLPVCLSHLYSLFSA